MNASGGTVSAVNLGGVYGLQVSGLSVMANGPQPGSSVAIQSAAGATVTGPPGPAASNIGSLTLGSASGGQNVLNVNAGQLNVTGVGGTTVNPTGVLNVSNGSIFQTTSLNVSGGSVSATGGGTLQPSGAVTVSGPGVLNVDMYSVFQTSSSTSLTVTGGQVMLNNLNPGTIGTATLSGGTTNFAASSTTVVTTATISAAANVTVGSQTSLANASVSGGQVYINTASTNPMTSLAVTGGSVSLASGVTIATADFSNPGTAAITAAGPLNITSQLKYSAAAAAVSSGNTIAFTPNGNLNNSTPVGTLAVSGGTMTLSSPLGIGPSVNVFLGAMPLSAGGNAVPFIPYVGPGPNTQDAGTLWNSPTAAFNVAATNVYTNLVNSRGGVTTVSFSAAGATTNWNDQGNTSYAQPGYAYSPLLSLYLGVGNGAVMTFAFGGLTPGQSYDVWGISNANNARSTQYVISGSSQTIAMNGNWATNSVTSPTTAVRFNRIHQPDCQRQRPDSHNPQRPQRQ